MESSRPMPKAWGRGNSPEVRGYEAKAEAEIDFHIIC